MDRPNLRVLLVSLPGISQRVLRNTFLNKPMVELVDVASGALSAVNLIDDHQPDMVVLDSNLPDSEKVELIKLMRQRYPMVYSLALVETSHGLHLATLAGADLAMRTTDLTLQLDELLVEVAARLSNRTQ
jgi:chemotaxis response regulator CheB